MVSALRQLGFDYVFDTDFSADLTIMEEGTELLARLTAAWQQQDTAAGQQGAQQAQQQGREEGAAAQQQQHGPGPLPLLTSCCPAWINEVELAYPQLIPYLSSCRSPQAMMGAVVKRVWAQKVCAMAGGCAGQRCPSVSV